MNRDELQFKYFLYSDTHPISEPSKEWNSPLRTERISASKPPRTVSLGEYFTASRKFFESIDIDQIIGNIRKMRGVPRGADHIESIHICIEKHGAYYHPSKVAFRDSEFPLSLMLNVAVSESGLECIKREFSLLSRLYKDYPLHFVPCVYTESDSADFDACGFQMFLGEWFEGYSEFHITETCDGKATIGVWDAEKGLVLLSDRECERVYEQAAMIHTYYFDVFSFERIHPWHHAAGDFIVHETGGGPELRLVTVRDYSPMIETDEINEEIVLGALLMFFLDLSIRMRLDRLNGDGSIVWAADYAIQGVIHGFFKGLALKRETGVYPDKSLETAFCHFVSQCSPDDFLNLALKIVGTYSDPPSELEFIQCHMADHLQKLYELTHKYAASRINTFFIDKE